MNKKIKNNFTLVEIAIVLVVLTALAGLVIPRALGYAQRSHGTSGAANMGQLEANINRYEIENFSMPNGWDNLIDNDGDTLAPFTTVALDADTFAALNNAGINSVHLLVEQGATSTNNEYTTFGGTSTTAATLAAAVNVSGVAGTTVVDVLGSANDSADTYVALGIGENLSAVGATLTSAPYDFPEGAESPSDSYRRFVAIFNVSGEKAKFVGIVANDDGTLTNIQDHIAEYYEATE